MADTTLELGTYGPRTGVLSQGLCAVVAWCTHQPSRVGEVIPLRGRGAVVLGRGADGDPGLVQQRPGDTVACPPLTDPYLSRQQLSLCARDGRVDVENLGRCPLRINGVRTDQGRVGPGDCVEIEQRLLLFITRRPTQFPACAAPLHPFAAPDADGFVGESPAAWILRDQLALVANRNRHVLVMGESGTGKELVARALHTRSDRRDGSLVSRNAATFPETLIDAEVFGNARNFPNPNMPERPGLIGQANGGTLFLDEVGELPPALQAHLLRVMDSGEYQRLGEARVRRADVRVVAATNRDASALKHDFAARFPLTLNVPPLRDRREDVPMLVRHLLQSIARTEATLAERYLDDQGEPRVELALVRFLLLHALPTNVRQLEKLLFDAILARPGPKVRMSKALVEAPTGPRAADDVPAAAPTSTAPPPTAEQLQESLTRHGGVQGKVWREFGLKDRYVLRRLLRKYENQGFSFYKGEPD
jgi:two-component system, NtrC family, response regulator HydG